MQLCSPLDAVTPIEVVKTPLDWYYYTEREPITRLLSTTDAGQLIDPRGAALTNLIPAGKL